MPLCEEATVTLTAVWKWGVSKRGILKSPVSHVVNFLGWIKLIFDHTYLCNFVIKGLNPTYEVQNMGNGAFQNAPFGNAR